MNVFFVPSWYPSESDPLPGIFFRNQALALSRQFADINIGISTWGQNDHRMLLWSREPMKSFQKRIIQRTPKANKVKIEERVTEYFTPAFTWTSKIWQGNMHGIILANRQNLLRYQEQHGKADIIHAHVGYPAGHIANVLSREFSIPYMITEQMSPFPHRYFLKNGRLTDALREAYTHSRLNIAISKALATSMARHGISRITVIPNPVDEQFFKPASWQIKNQPFTFFSLGRIVPQKGIDLLLQAFARLKMEIDLRIGGDGEMLGSYQKLAEELGISEKVSWLGELNQDSVRDEMQKCDAFVLPSRHESLGVVFAEAMACGKPVIGTICGGPEEIIEEQTGLLIEKEKIDKLVSAMRIVATRQTVFDPKLIRSRFEKRFSFPVVAKKIYEQYLILQADKERKK